MSSCVPAPHRAEASRIARTLRSSPSNNGFCHLGIDGVYRSFNSRLEVVDYKQLDPDQIQAMLRSFEGLVDSEALKAAEEKFRGVDGRSVTDMEQLLHPNPDFAPKIDSEALKAAAEKFQGVDGRNVAEMEKIA